MTAIKQVAVTRTQHLRSLASYLDTSNERHEACARGSQNLADDRDWADEMDRTREAHGHNSPARKGARVTYMYHQILAFNPDDCSMNGGRMDARACMDYAADYVRRRYPDQEAVWTLHREHSKDGTDRWAVHIGINRTNLATGRRLDEGPARKARASRIATVREMDAEYGLRQLTRGKRNSRTHGRQRSQGERKAQKALVMEAKSQGRDPIPTQNERVRRAVARSIEETRLSQGVSDPEAEFRRRLATRGITLASSATGDYQYRWREGNAVRKVNGIHLGEIRMRGGRVFRFSRGAVRAALGMERYLARQAEREREEEGRGR